MSGAIGIVDTGTALGSVVKRNLEKFPGSVEQNYLEHTVGILQTCHKRPEQTAVDLCLQAFADLLNRQVLDVASVEVLVVVSQHTRANIPPLSAALSGALGLAENIYCLDLSIGCTGFVQGLHALTAVMNSLGAKCGLLFNVETLSEVLAEDDPGTNYIFSDAATCTLVGRDQAFAIPELFDFGTSGARCLALNANSSKLHMDGLEIYKYVTSTVPRMLHRLLEASGFKPQDLDFIFFHQASLRTVDKLKQSFPAVRAPYEIAAYGNTASCSIPFLLKKYREEIKRAQHGRLILSAFGSGLSYANCLMRSAAHCPT